MALNFPANPQDGDEYGKYVYNAAKNVWSSSATPPRYLVSQNVPSTANNGDVWFNTSTARSYIYYEDADSSQWVEIGGAEGAVGTPSELGDIPGIDLTGLADGKTLVYDAANSEWIPGEAGGKFTVSDTAPSEAENGDTWFKSDDGKTYIYYVDADGGQWVEIASNTTGYLDIGQLNDVTIVSPTTGQALTYDGSGWVNATPASTLGSLTDVSDSAPADGQALVYNDSSGEWEPGAAAPSGVNVAGSDNIALDFSDNVPLEKRTVTGDVVFTASNYSAGATKKVYLEGDTVQRSLTFPSSWNFITDKPTAIGADKKNILDLNSFGTSESTTVAIWLGASSFEPITASGGTEYEIQVNGITYIVHEFASSGSLNVASLGDDGTVDYLIVGGGGGSASGGGGAGGFLTGTTAAQTGINSVTVGAGGAYSAGTVQGATNGGNSELFGIIAYGGGFGGGSRYGVGGNGGSGGGASYDATSVALATGVAGQGNSGGRSSFGSSGGGGGGGGAYSAGLTPTVVNYGGNGGDGKPSSITGSDIYYAGGGGAGANTPGTSIAGQGGIGGGGNGAAAHLGSGFPGVSGTGGGAGGGDPEGSGATGGSGIVIIRYPITNPN